MHFLSIGRVLPTAADFDMPGFSTHLQSVLKGRPNYGTFVVDKGPMADARGPGHRQN
jgi:hypothetical protein